MILITYKLFGFLHALKSHFVLEREHMKTFTETNSCLHSFSLWQMQTWKAPGLISLPCIALQNTPSAYPLQRPALPRFPKTQKPHPTSLNLVGGSDSKVISHFKWRGKPIFLERIIFYLAILVSGGRNFSKLRELAI